MDRLHLLILSLRDEMAENCLMVQDCISGILPKRHNTVGVATGDLSQDSDGRVWVEVGGPGLKLRVMHLHPANPSVADAVMTRLSTPDQGDNIIKLPAEDEISLASLEDYWFNHWQGPYITADSNQNTVNFRRSRRSLRKSKRKFRCSVCNKKIVGPVGHRDELQEVPCFDGENVLAHVPSVKLESRSPKTEEVAAVSSDDECIKPATSEEALSRYSASDEQLARAYRVLDNELRTSFTLFAEEAVTQDVVDGVSMNVNDSTSSHDASMRLAPPLLSPRQSRSCPCSPKLSGRNHSPKSNTGSPKPQSRSVSSKFSLSSSLMAIHRQASNSLRPDFLRFDLGKGDFGGSNSKNGSQQNSLRNESRHSRPTVEAHNSSFGDSHLDSSNSGSLRGESSKQESSRIALHESHSLPTLKLSKMSLTYKGGIIINHDKDVAQMHYSDASKLLVEGACALPSTPEDDTFSGELIGPPMLLPDVVPRYEVGGPSMTQMCEYKPSTSSAPLTPKELCVNYHYDAKDGVVNLGFDGHEESSDFTNLNEVMSTKASDMEINSPAHVSRRGSAGSDIDIGKYNIQMNIASIHAISIGHVPQGQDVALSLEVPQAKTQELSQGGAEAYISDASDTPSSSCPATPSTASPSLSPYVPSTDTTSASLQRPPVDDIDEDYPPYDHMQEARQLVFWWQKSNPNEDTEFCQNNAECKVKQKPLLLFLHGMGGSSDHWRQQLWYFVSCGYEVVAPDLMGHGLSSAPKDPSQYTFSQMLDHITLVFDLFVPQGRKCVIVGHGYGCSLAAALARGRAMSVRLVILASCGGPNPLIPNPPSKSFLHSRFATFLGPFLSCGCCSREILYAPRGKHFAAGTLAGLAITPTPRYVLEYMAKGQNWPEGDVAFHRRITVPTLLLHGMKDDRVSLVEMCEMERTIPRAFLEMVPGGGHDLMTDAPLEVCHAIHRFIKRWKQQL
nr:uncharacterized protein LOC123748302 [Procambarus clarkii]